MDLSCGKKLSDVWKLSRLKHTPVPVGYFFDVAVAFPSPPLLTCYWSFHSWLFFCVLAEASIYMLSLKHLEALVNMHLRANLLFKEQLK